MKITIFVIYSEFSLKFCKRLRKDLEPEKVEIKTFNFPGKSFYI